MLFLIKENISLNNTQLNAVVMQKVEVSSDVMILRISPNSWILKDFIPGQFTILGLPGNAPRISLSDKEDKNQDLNKIIKRPYSVASSSVAKEYLEFYIALVRSGALTPRLFNLHIGDKIFLSEDFRGMFTLNDVPKDKNIILIATGTGLSPYMSMIRSLLTTGLNTKMIIIHGAKHSWDLGYISELMTMQKLCPNFTYLPVISLPEEEPVTWKGHTGFLHEIWNSKVLDTTFKFSPSPDNSHIFLCGNPLMVEGMMKELMKQGFDEQIHTEKFT